MVAHAKVTRRITSPFGVLCRVIACTVFLIVSRDVVVPGDNVGIAQSGNQLLEDFGFFDRGCLLTLH